MPGSDERKEVRDRIWDQLLNGRLNEVITLFGSNEDLYPLVIDMVRDENLKIRIGGTAIVEALARQRPGGFVRLIPEIAKLLKSASPIIRSDGAYLLGLIGHKSALPYLMEAADDAHTHARDVIREVIAEITDG